MFEIVCEGAENAKSAFDTSIERTLFVVVLRSINELDELGVGRR